MSAVAAGKSGGAGGRMTLTSWAERYQALFGRAGGTVVRWEGWRRREGLAGDDDAAFRWVVGAKFARVVGNRLGIYLAPFYLLVSTVQFLPADGFRVDQRGHVAVVPDAGRPRWECSLSQCTGSVARRLQTFFPLLNSPSRGLDGTIKKRRMPVCQCWTLRAARVGFRCCFQPLSSRHLLSGAPLPP